MRGWWEGVGGDVSGLRGKLQCVGLVAPTQENMLVDKSQLTRLVKGACVSEEVVRASRGKAQVKLVPLVAESGLQQPGSLRGAMPHPGACDAAFSDSVEAEVSALMNG